MALPHELRKLLLNKILRLKERFCNPNETRPRHCAARRARAGRRDHGDPRSGLTECFCPPTARGRQTAAPLVRSLARSDEVRAPRASQTRPIASAVLLFAPGERPCSVRWGLPAPGGAGARSRRSVPRARCDSASCMHCLRRLIRPLSGPEAQRCGGAGRGLGGHRARLCCYRGPIPVALLPAVCAAARMRAGRRV